MSIDEVMAVLLQDIAFVMKEGVVYKLDSGDPGPTTVVERKD